jgi:hypothetical protein
MIPRQDENVIIGELCVTDGRGSPDEEGPERSVAPNSRTRRGTPERPHMVTRKIMDLFRN